MDVLLKMEDIPASYVSLPECNNYRRTTSGCFNSKWNNIITFPLLDPQLSVPRRHLSFWRVGACPRYVSKHVHVFKSNCLHPQSTKATNKTVLCTKKTFQHGSTSNLFATSKMEKKKWITSHQFNFFKEKSLGSFVSQPGGKKRLHKV